MAGDQSWHRRVVARIGSGRTAGADDPQDSTQPERDGTVVVEQSLDSATVIQFFQQPPSRGERNPVLWPRREHSRYGRAKGSSAGACSRGRRARNRARALRRAGACGISGPLTTDRSTQPPRAKSSPCRSTSRAAGNQLGHDADGDLLRRHRTDRKPTGTRTRFKPAGGHSGRRERFVMTAFFRLLPNSPT